MKSLLRHLDPVRLLVLGLLALPALAILAMGLFWLWHSDHRLLWLIAMAACAALGYGLQQWLLRRDRTLLENTLTTADPDWPPNADEVWQAVEALADNVAPDDWPLDDGSRMLELGRRTLETVSRRYHPDVDKPLLELTVPHALLIVERACRDLRIDVTQQIPLSHRLTIGDLLRIKRWKAGAERMFDAYRVGRAVVNPVSALIGEVKGHLLSGSAGLARNELHRWFLQAFVRKVGYYAIDLYSGRLPLGDEKPLTTPTQQSAADTRAADRQDDVEPLRVLVLGRANAGKSSLINALFGRLTSATDVLPDTTRTLTPFSLTREGMTQALIFDTPGCDTALFDADEIDAATREADLILWVSAVHRPDRQQERVQLDALRAAQAQRRDRHPAPLIVVATHIDHLRPAREWSPPYDLVAASGAKATSIRAAVQALADDFALSLDQVVPVCLGEGRTYNVDDGLWSAILAQQDAALRVRLLRCLDARRRDENWRLLRTQLLATGRLLRDLPGRIGKFTAR